MCEGRINLSNASSFYEEFSAPNMANGKNYISVIMNPLFIKDLLDYISGSSSVS